jgi:hypothetical protein
VRLNLVRDQCGAVCTMGQLYLDGKFQCYTLEDVVRPDGVKIHGQTAIPEGRYEIQITMSPRFKRELPILLDVPNFAGVRIHSGNTAADTEGCILVGRQRATHQVLESRLAFEPLFAKLQAAIAIGDTPWLTIQSL